MPNSSGEKSKLKAAPRNPVEPFHCAAPQPQAAHQKLIQQPDHESKKHMTRESAAALIGEQDVGARSAFRIRQNPMFLNDQLTPQRNHEQHSQDSADQ